MGVPAEARGVLHLIDGSSMCIVDIGDISYVWGKISVRVAPRRRLFQERPRGRASAHAGRGRQSAVLVDDVTGTGEQQIVLASSTGVVYLLSTPFIAQPLSSWSVALRCCPFDPTRH